MVKRARGKKRGRRQPASKPATQQFVKSTITRTLGYNTGAYYSDGLVLAASTTQQYVDFTAALIAAEAVVGDSVDHVHLVTRGVISYADTTNWVRMVWFRWKPDTGVGAPGSNSILRNDATAYAMDGLPFWEEKGQFKILSDKMYYVTTDGSNYQHRHFVTSFGAKALGRATKDGATSGGANHVYLLYLSDSGAVSHPTISMNTRILYRGEK